MAKRGKLEIVKDILTIVSECRSPIRITPLIRRSNLSSSRFKEYYTELVSKKFVSEVSNGSGKSVMLTDKGKRFLDKYSTIVSFIDEFEL